MYVLKTPPGSIVYINFCLVDPLNRVHYLRDSQSRPRAQQKDPRLSSLVKVLAAAHVSVCHIHGVQVVTDTGPISCVVVRAKNAEGLPGGGTTHHDRDEMQLTIVEIYW